MNFRRAVVDPEGAHVAKDSLHDRVPRGAKPTQDLHRAVRNAGNSLRTNDLGHRTFARCAFALIEQPSCMPNSELRDVDVHRVIRQHKGYSFVLADRLVEGGAPRCILTGDLLSPDGGTKPAHAMCQARRCEPDLRVAVTLANLAENGFARNTQTVEP